MVKKVVVVHRAWKSTITIKFYRLCHDAVTFDVNRDVTS